MNAISVRVLAALLLIFGIGVSVSAADSSEKTAQDKEKKQAEDGLDTIKEDFLQAGNMVGMDIRNMEGADLGTVTDLLIDENHRVRFVIFATGDLMGLGGTEYLVPYASFIKLMETREGFVQISEEDLTKIPEFENDTDPEQYGIEIYKHYGLQSYWKTSAPEK